MTERLRRIEKTLPWRELEGELVIVDPASQQAHFLNASAVLVWKLLESGPRSFDEIASAMRVLYGIDEAQAAKDARAFAEALVVAGLAELVQGEG